MTKADRLTLIRMAIDAIDWQRGYSDSWAGVKDEEGRATRRRCAERVRQYEALRDKLLKEGR